MKRPLLLLVLLAGLQATAHAQKPRKPVPPPPPPPPIVRISEHREAARTPYEKLLLDEKSWPLAFRHAVDADTVILPKQVFQKQLEVSSNGVRLEISSAKDTMQVQKGVEGRLTSSYVKFSFYKVTVAKDVATLTDKETGKILKYKLFLNSAKTKIIKLQDLSTKELYLPAQYVGPMIMMPSGL